MFIKKERQAFQQILSTGYQDCFRHLHPLTTGEYTWGTYLYAAKQRNIGWRLDYFLASKTVKIEYYKSFMLANYSDHCPIMLQVRVNNSNVY